MSNYQTNNQYPTLGGQQYATIPSHPYHQQQVVPLLPGNHNERTHPEISMFADKEFFQDPNIYDCTRQLLQACNWVYRLTFNMIVAVLMVISLVVSPVAAIVFALFEILSQIGRVLARPFGKLWLELLGQQRLVQKRIDFMDHFMHNPSPLSPQHMV